MDIHNLDEYLDLQDQNQMNLLATEELAEPEPKEAEWHAGGSLDTLLDPTAYLFNENNTNTDWGLLQNGLVDGINLTEIIGNGGILVSNQDNFITPDSLFKQQPIVNVEEKRVTRSRASSTPKAAVSTPAPKKKKKATKKLYCICQQPYNGKPMVQCDSCEEWFHCSCVDFDPDDQEGEDIDWVCKKCLEAKQTEPKVEPKQKVTITTTSTEETPASEPSPPVAATAATVVTQPKVTITIPAPSSTRQTRGSNRNQSQCLYSGCNNRTRADSYCSDVCARKKDEEKAVKEEKAPRVTRTSRMRTASMSGEVSKPRRASTTKKSPPVVTKDDEDNVKENDTEYKEEENEEEEEEDDEGEEKEKKVKEKDEKEVEVEEEESTREGTETPDTPMSPSQMTENENPVRRNVIKNISNILKIIMESALTENPDLFDAEEKISNEERADKLARSIENTMLEQLGDSKQQRQRTCGEPYKSKFRSLLYNLKDKQNKVFQVRVITGDLSPSELVKMSSEDMANPELKSMSEVLRKTALKNSVMKMDNTPIIKKTHKGDIIMVPNKDNDTNQNMYSEQVENIHIEKPIIPTTPSPPTTDSPTKTDDQQQQQQLEHYRTSISSFSPTSTRSKLDPLDDILARIGIPAHDDHGKRGSSDASTADQIKKRKVTLDVAELLGEEEESPFEVEEVDTSELLQPEEQSEDVEMEEATQQEEKVTTETEEDVLPTIWQGRVNMPQIAEFEASARQIGGRLLSETEWAEVLSPTMWIEGRIPAERVTSYVTQSQYSSSREIVLLEIDPDTNDPTKPKETQLLNEAQSQKLLKYLDSRQRYAVVGHNKTKVKDFYLIPLYKVQHIPDCLYVVRVEETKRKCDLFLGVLVLTKTTAAAKPTTLPLPPTTTTTKQVYSTPMAQPMYLSTQTYPNSYQPPTTNTYQPPPTTTTNTYQPLPPTTTTNTYQPPPPTTTNNYNQQQQQPRQEYGYGYQKPSYGRQPPNNQNNQRNQYGSYNQRNQNNYRSSYYRPSY